MIKPKPTFREIQLKLNAHYIKQPKPKHVKLFEGSMALRNSIEVILHPHSPVKL